MTKPNSTLLQMLEIGRSALLDAQRDKPGCVSLEGRFEMHGPGGQRVDARFLVAVDTEGQLGVVLPDGPEAGAPFVLWCYDPSGGWSRRRAFRLLPGKTLNDLAEVLAGAHGGTVRKVVATPPEDRN